MTDKEKQHAEANFNDFLNGIQVTTPAFISPNSNLHLSLDGLPQRFSDFVTHVAHVTNVPTEIALVSAMTVAGAAIGGGVTSKVFNHVNRPCLWTAIVAKSGDGKSDPLKIAMKPLLDMDGERVRAYRKELKTYRENEASNKKNNTPKPRKEQIVCGKSTGAAREQMLNDNPRGVILYRDELRGFLKDLNGYGGTSDIEDLLSIYESRPLKVDRASEDDLRYCEHPFLPILGSIQTATLRESFTNELLNNGFFTRFMVGMFDTEPTKEMREFSDSVAASWANIVYKLRDFGNTFREFRATAEAQEIYKNRSYDLKVLGRVADTAMSDSYNEYKAGAYSKTLYSVARLALIAHVLKIVESNSVYPYPDIDANTMTWAFDCAPYLCAMQMRAYEAIVGKQEDKPMKTDALIRAIARHLADRNKQLNQSALAEMLGTSQPNISRALRGQK